MRVRIYMLVLLTAAVGCRGGQDDETPADTEAEVVAAAPRVEPLTDAQVLGVLSAISAGAVEAARNPARRIEAPELRRLVEVVRADHEALQAELSAIADSLRLTPAEHPSAGRVRAAAQAAAGDTSQMEFGASDGSVLEQQIELHTTLLAVLDSVVIPGMQPTMLADYVRASRPTMAAHLQRARQLELLLREAAVQPSSAPRPSTAPAPAAPPAALDTTPPPPPPDTGVVRRELQR